MARVEPVGDLEIGRDLEFQWRQWRFQRVAWVAMALVLLAALGGLLGSGPLSDSSAQAGPLRLDYGRFERRHAPEALDIEVDGGVASDGRVELWLSTDYLDGIELQSVVPEPVEVVTAGDRTVFAFAVGNPDEPTTVRFALEHDEVGVADGRIGVGGGPELAFWQVVYP